MHDTHKEFLHTERKYRVFRTSLYTAILPYMQPCSSPGILVSYAHLFVFDDTSSWCFICPISFLWKQFELVLLVFCCYNFAAIFEGIFHCCSFCPCFSDFSALPKAFIEVTIGMFPNLFTLVLALSILGCTIGSDYSLFAHSAPFIMFAFISGWSPLIFKCS